MKDLTQALHDLITIFEHMRVPYAVMGGIAVRTYGIPRPTHDVDFTIALPRPDLPRLYRAVRDAGLTVPEAHERGWVDEVAGLPLVHVRLYLEAGRAVDLDLFLAEAPYQKKLMSRRRCERVGNASIWMVSPEDLILLKLLANRPRDRADIGDVLFTQGQLDETYLRDWAKELGIEERLELILRDPPPV